MVFEPTDASGRFYELRVVYRSELWRSPRLESAFYTRHLKNFKFAELGKYVRLGLSPSGEFDDAGNAVHLKTSLVDGDRMHVVLYVTSAANRTVDQVEIEMTRYVPTDLELAEQRLMARMEQKVQQMGGEKYDITKVEDGDDIIFLDYHGNFKNFDYKRVFKTNFETETPEYRNFLSNEIYKYYNSNKKWWVNFYEKFIPIHTKFEPYSTDDFMNYQIELVKLALTKSYTDILQLYNQKDYTRYGLPFLHNVHILNYLSSKMHIVKIYKKTFGIIGLVIVINKMKSPNNKKYISYVPYPIPKYSFNMVSKDELYEIIEN